MAERGWYPDPGGRAGHYRFWDGQSWGLSTTTELPGGATPPDPDPGAPKRSHGTRRVLAGTAAAVVLVLLVVGALVLRESSSTVVDPAPVSSATAPGGGDTSAAPTPSPTPSPTPTPTLTSTSTPSASPTPSPSGAPCPVGDPFARQDYPRDGRVHGGSLSFPRQRGWTEPGDQTSSFTWAYDVGETDVRVQPQWATVYAVGALSVADGFEDPRSGAELSMRCTVGSALYSNVTSRTDLVDEATTVDGYRAWTVRSEIRTYDARTSYGGDTVQVTVVDLGSPEALAFFWGSAPIGDEALTARLDQVVEQLGVS